MTTLNETMSVNNYNSPPVPNAPYILQCPAIVEKSPGDLVNIVLGVLDLADDNLVIKDKELYIKVDIQELSVYVTFHINFWTHEDKVILEFNHKSHRSFESVAIFIKNRNEIIQKLKEKGLVIEEKRKSTAMSLKPLPVPESEKDTSPGAMEAIHNSISDLIECALESGGTQLQMAEILHNTYKTTPEKFADVHFTKITRIIKQYVDGDLSVPADILDIFKEIKKV